MEPLNRVALLVRPKRRYKEWADSVATGDEDPIFDLDMARTTPQVYLVAAREYESAEDLIDEYSADIFETELEAWHTDEARWPINRSPHVFRDWFEVTLGEMVVDLDPGESLDIGDIDSQDEKAELLEALAGVPGAALWCAWCGKEIAPETKATTVELKGPRDSRAEAEVIELSVAGRLVPAVVPGDDSDGARSGVMAFLMFCSDECGREFLDAWNGERGEA